jgi:hypothetical protein
MNETNDRTSRAELLRRYWTITPEDDVETTCDRVWKRIQEDLKRYDASLRSTYGDGWLAVPLDPVEFQVLTAASLLNGEPTLASICAWLRGHVGPVIATQVRFLLGDLERRRLIESWYSLLEDSTVKSRERRYEVTDEGILALRRAKLEGKQLLHRPRQQAKAQHSCVVRQG